MHISVLVAPLDWGLGHATRCIPIIRQLVNSGSNVAIACDGLPQILLKKEFPQLEFLPLPGYRISYAKKAGWLPLRILLQIPRILFSIKHEHRWLQQITRSRKFDLIISDNRYGLYHPQIRSVIVCHQLQVKSRFKISDYLLRKMHYRFIEKFTECWIPDAHGNPNLAGILSHPPGRPKIPLYYLGPLSRFSGKMPLETPIELLVLLSGPEPQRTILENILLHQLSELRITTVFIRGLPGNNQQLRARDGITFISHLSADELERILCNAQMVICRSGYTTIMDLVRLGKKAILIPTPGQTEQDYLARHLQEQGWFLSAEQASFSLEEALKQAAGFPFARPDINMDCYKAVIDNVLKELGQRNLG